MSADPFLDAHLLPAIFAAADEPGHDPVVPTARDLLDQEPGPLHGDVQSSVNPFGPN